MVRVVQARLETDYGTDDTANTYYPLRVTDISEEFNRNEMVEEATDVYITPYVVAGGLAPSGSFDANFRPGAMHPFLYALMGAADDSEGADDTYNYTFAAPKSLTVQIQDTIEDVSEKREFAGVGVESIDFGFSVNEFVTCSISWFARDYKVASGDIAYEGTYDPEQQPAVFWEAELYKDDDTTPMLVFKDLTLNVTRALDDGQYVIGSHYRQRLVRTGQTEVTGSLQVGEWEKNELKRAMYGATDGTVTTANALGNLKLVIKGSNFKITCPKIIYNNASRSSTGVAEIDTSFDFRVVDTEDDEFTIACDKATFAT
jgi:hypothetical protein